MSDIMRVRREDWDNLTRAADLLKRAALAVESECDELRERIAALEAERYALKDELRQANGVRDVFASAVVAQAMQEVDKMPNPQEGPVDKSTGLQGPDPNGVICPQCVTQFRAVPVNVQARIAALRRVVAAADAMHEAWYDGKDGEVARLMRDYDAPRAALKASD